MWNISMGYVISHAHHFHQQKHAGTIIEIWSGSYQDTVMDWNLNLYEWSFRLLCLKIYLKRYLIFTISLQK